MCPEWHSTDKKPRQFSNQRGGEFLICSDHHGRVRLPDARNASDNEFPELQIVVRVER